MIVLHRAGIALLLLSCSATALACRCAERPLADHYAAADTVLMASIESVVASAADTSRKVVQFRALAPGWKAAPQQSMQGLFHTGTSSASCALDVSAGEVWLLFLPQQQDALVTGCGGSRVLRSTAGSDADVASGDFMDVPARFVASQLNALAGLDLLRDLQDSASARLLGLLDIKTFAHGGSAWLYADASVSAEVIASIDSMDQLQHREASYEYAAASVYAYNDFGHQVKLADGRSGWLAREHAGTWFAYEELIIKRLNYLHRDWHGLLWPAAGAGLPLRLSGTNAAGREHAATVKASMRVADSLWLQLDLLSSDGCNGKPAKIIASGWTPAWLVNGEPAAWFHSRGC